MGLLIATIAGAAHADAPTVANHGFEQPAYRKAMQIAGPSAMRPKVS